MVSGGARPRARRRRARPCGVGQVARWSKRCPPRIAASACGSTAGSLPRGDAQVVRSQGLAGRDRPARAPVVHARTADACDTLGAGHCTRDRLSSSSACAASTTTLGAEPPSRARPSASIPAGSRYALVVAETQGLGAVTILRVCVILVVPGLVPALATQASVARALLIAPVVTALMTSAAAIAEFLTRSSLIPWFVLAALATNLLAARHLYRGERDRLRHCRCRSRCSCSPSPERSRRRRRSPRASDSTLARTGSTTRGGSSAGEMSSRAS